MGLFTAKIGKITRKGFTARQKHLGALNGIIEESISGLKVIKLYGAEDELVKEFSETKHQIKRYRIQSTSICWICNACN